MELKNKVSVCANLFRLLTLTIHVLLSFVVQIYIYFYFNFRCPISALPDLPDLSYLPVQNHMKPEKERRAYSGHVNFYF